MQRIFAASRVLTLSTFDDFSFRDRWSGLFLLDEKVLNYIAVKTEHGWAAPENALPDKTNVGEERITLHHNINGHPVSVVISVDKYELRVGVTGSKENTLEIGICQRHAYEDKCRRVEAKGTSIRAGHVLINLPTDKINIEKRIQWQGDKEYEICVAQIPFGSEIRILLEHIPARLVTNTKTWKTALRTELPEWDSIYYHARKTIRILTKRRGWYAGLPWFVQYWARDTFLSVPALIREGYAPLVRRVLLDFLYSKVDGEIPRLIKEDGTPEFGSIDANPLFLNAVADYVRMSGDYAFLRENKQDILEVLYWLESEFPDYTARSRGKDTWMDTLETRKYPIEVQAYWAEAARKLDALGITSGKFLSVKEAFEQNKKKFLLERSANVLLAAVYNLIPAEEAMKYVKEWKLITKYGVRTLSPEEIEYDPKGYHTGAVWGLTTGAGLYVALKAKDWETANILLSALVRRQTWTKYLDEVWNAETGEPVGADAQLWSAALAIRAIDEVIIDRRTIPPEIKRIKRIRWDHGITKRITLGEK